MDWIDVNDRLPESSGGFLIFEYGVMTAWFESNSKKWFGEELIQNPTHWMSLPNPPASSNKGYVK